MYTDVVSWIFAFLFLGAFAFLAGFFAGRKDLPVAGRIVGVFFFVFLFAITAVLTVRVVEDTIGSVANDAMREGISYRKVEQLLDNRFLLAPGWYEVVEPPIAHPLFPNDTTMYVSLAVRADGVGPLEVAFPMGSWKLVPPRPKVEWLGERWALVRLPQPQPKAIRLERYEGREYGYESRVIEARM